MKRKRDDEDDWSDESTDSEVEHEKLIDAAASGEISRMQDLLEKGAFVNVQSSYDLETPLFRACYAEKLEAAKVLIENGAKVNAKNKDRETPLHAACGSSELVKFLIENGAKVTAKTKKKLTPLHEAAVRGFCPVETFKLLIENGAKVNAKDKYGDTPLHAACCQDNYSDFQYCEGLKFLIENGASVDAKNNDGDTPLHMASMGWDEITEVLTENGADVNAKNNDECTPLHSAVNYLIRIANNVPRRLDPEKPFTLDLKATKLLIDHGADVNAKNKDGRTPFFEACLGLKGRTNDIKFPETWDFGFGLVKFLIENGANLDAKDNYGATSLHVACYSGNLDVVQLLVSRGANVNVATTRRGVTPLHVASKENHLDVVWFLVRQHPWLVLE